MEFLDHWWFNGVMIYVSYAMKTNPDMQPSYLLGFGSKFVASFFVLFGILQQKKADNNVISFRKAFKTGFFITLIISTIYVLAWLVIYYNFFPDFVEKYAEIMKKVTPPEELAARQDELEFYRKAYATPFGVIALTYMEILIFLLPATLVYSLIVVFALKKK